MWLGVCALALDPGSEGRLHPGWVALDQALEAREAPVVPVRRGEVEHRIQEPRVLEEPAGTWQGSMGLRLRMPIP